ncbi:hypothetical protein PhaeoP88_00717 [Phaeobacter inhibens]|uniref:Uncharacterized protein n=1 Tax=Phaeobacter inhibens TaxID=221822 RepID=A0A2I7K6C8_9RHOB|nr:hypothetical protein PhaeoP88_00717 [Phaeobacter inhibens]
MNALIDLVAAIAGPVLRHRARCVVCFLRSSTWGRVRLALSLVLWAALCIAAIAMQPIQHQKGHPYETHHP